MFSLFIRAQFQHDLIGVLEYWSVGVLRICPSESHPLGGFRFGNADCRTLTWYPMCILLFSIRNPKSEIKNRKALDQHGMPVSNFRT